MATPEPRPVSLVDGIELVVPPSFEGILPVSPCAEPFAYEIETFEALRRVLRPGMTVLDAGCNFGVTPVLAGLLMGGRGSVHAFDGNADVLPRARELAQANGLAVEFTCALVGDTPKAAVSFFAVPGYLSPASTRNAEILAFHPDAERREVPMVSLDAYCEERGIIPGCIKIDVEGAEHTTLCGARRLLEAHHPALIIETHGPEVLGIGGSVAVLAEMLESLGYAIEDMGSGCRVTAAAYADRYASRIGHLLATV